MFRENTVPCFTRSPRQGTGYERDLKQTKQNKTRNTKARFATKRKAASTANDPISTVCKYEHCEKMKLTFVVHNLEFDGDISSCTYNYVFQLIILASVRH